MIELYVKILKYRKCRTDIYNHGVVEAESETPIQHWCLLSNFGIPGTVPAVLLVGSNVDIQSTAYVAVILTCDNSVAYSCGNQRVA